MPKLFNTIQAIGITRRVELLLNASEVIIRDSDEGVFRLGMSE